GIAASFLYRRSPYVTTRQTGRTMMRQRTTALWTVVAAFASSATLAATTFTNPPELASVNGVLSGTLTVAPASVKVGAKTVTTTVYDGLLMPPLLRVQPGDLIQLQLRNDGAMSTNIHYHGFGVTPLGPGDNVFLN